MAPARALIGLRLVVSALAVSGLLLYSCGAPAQSVRGVTETEIIIGSVTDLSSFGALQGVNNSDAIRMVFDDANAKGGVHGRKIQVYRPGQPVQRATRGSGNEQTTQQR